MLRERRDTSLAHMQDVSLEVEPNVLEVDQLRNKINRDKGREKVEASTSSSSTSPPLKWMK
jgi:hypothetical protein